MLEKKNHSSLLLVGILLVGVCMRMPITALPSVIKDIAASFQVAPNSLGILTTIPLLCFGFISPLVSLLARKIGNEATIGLALLLLIVGSFVRIFNFWSLLGGTVLVGLAITGFNVLLPAVIADKLPDKIGSTTGMYNVAITSFSAIGAYTISPLSQAASWQVAIVIISLVAVLTAIVWLPNLKYNQPEKLVPTTDAPGETNMWKNKTAWYLVFYFGAQSFVFYSIVAWLPAIALAAGLTQDQASLVAGFFQLFSMPFALVIPVVATRLSHLRRRWFALFAGIAAVASLGMLFFAVNSVWYYLLVALLMGMAIGTTFPLGLTVFGLKTRNAADTRNLSGMVQSAGYLLAATGPVIVGHLNAATHSWQAGLVVLLGAVVVFTVAGLLAGRRHYV